MIELNFISQRILPLFAYINLFLIFLFLLLSCQIILKRLKKIRKIYWLVVFIILIISLLIRIYLAPHHHRFFIDESFYIGTAKNILYYFKSIISIGYYPKQIGWPALLAISFLIFGVNNYVAIYTSLFFGSLSIFLIFILVYIISKNERLAIISSFFLAILPLHVIYSGTAETVITSIFFLLATIICFLILVDNQNTKLIFLTLFLFTFTIQLRFENVLILIPMLIFIFLKGVHLRWRKWIMPLIFSLPFFIIYIFQLFELINFYTDIYARKIVLFGFGGIGNNFLSLFDFSFLNIILCVLVVIGIFLLYKYERKIAIFFIIWFFVYFCFYLLYIYADDFHMLTGLVALLPIMAYPICFIHNFLKIKKGNLFDIIVIVIFIFLFLISFDRDPIPEYLLETQALEKLKKDIPDDCIVVIEVPVIITSVTDLRAVDTIYFLDKTDESLIAYKDRCILFYEDVYCKKDMLPKSRRRCEIMHERFRLTEYKEYEGMNVTFYLYTISKKQKI